MREPLQQLPPIRAQAGLVGAELVLDHLPDLVRRPSPRAVELPQRHHHRRLADDPVPTVDDLGEPGQGLQAVPGVRLPHGLGCRLDRLGHPGRLRPSPPLSAFPAFPPCFLPPFPFPGFEPAAAADCSWTARIASWMSCSDMWEYQTSNVRIAANSAIADRYALHRLPGHRLGVGRGEAVVAGRDGEARRHPLQVVLERARQGLVEVVQAEHQLPLG